MAENQVTKIYDLKTIGYDDVFQKLNAINNMFAAIKKSKQDLNNVKEASTNAAEINEINRKLADRDRIIASLEKQVKQLTESTKRMNEEEAKMRNSPDTAATKVSQYSQLIAKYKEATAAARELALQYGAESQQAQAAARVAAGYKTELTAINNLIKNGSAQTALLTQEQARNTERTKQLNQETRQLARDQIAAANSVEKLRAQLALATARRNTLVIDSEDFKLAEKDVAELNKRLSEIEQRSGDFRRNVGNYKSGFDGVRNSINQLTREAPAFANSIQTGFLALSNNIPIFFDEIGKARAEITRLRAEGQQVPSLFQRLTGALLSWGTALSLGVTLLTIYGKEIGEFVSALFKGTKALNDFELSQRALGAALSDSNSEYGSAIKSVKELTQFVQLAKNGLLDKKVVVDKYNESVGTVNGQLKTFSEVEKAVSDEAALNRYVAAMRARAVANELLTQSVQKQIEAEKLRELGRETSSGDRLSAAFDDRISFATRLRILSGSNDADAIAGINLVKNSRINKEADVAEKEADNLSELYKKKIAEAFNDVVIPPPKIDSSKLDTETKEELKRLDALRNTLISEENKRQNEIASIRRVSFEEEIAYAKNIEEIEANVLERQIKVIQRKKNLNAEEEQTLSEFRERLSKIYLDTSIKIGDIEKKRYDQEEKLINQRLQLRTNALEREKALINEDPTISAQDRAQAQLEIDQAILDEQLLALAQLEQQKDQFNQDSITRQKEAIARTNQVLAEDRKKVSLAEIQDLETDFQKKKAKINAVYAETRKSILDNDKLTDAQKKKQLAELEKAENRTILSAEVEKLITETALKEVLLKRGEFSEEEYLKKVAELRQKAADLSALTGGNAGAQSQNRGAGNFRDLLTGGRSGSGGLRGLFGIDPDNPDDGEKDKLLAQVIATSFDVARQAMEGYFAAEEQNIRNSLRVAQERLKIEEEQALNRAQTQQEEEALRRQFDAKKRAEEKKAGEDLKKVKIAEARIALATELANIAAAAASNPANGVTFGAAGIAMYGILSGLALARYALNVNNINRTQFFEQGGQVPTKGGKFGGKPHSEGGTPFQFQGQSFEAEVGELAIVRTKNAPKGQTYNVTGTQEQIASMLNQIGGGRPFAPGARMTKFEFGGRLGENLQPPVFNTVSTISNAANQSDLIELAKGFESLANNFQQVAQEQASRLDRIEVIQVTSSVTNAQKKEALQSNIAVL